MSFLKKLLKSYLFFFIILTFTLLIYTFLIYNEFISTEETSIRITTYIIGCFLFLILGFITSRQFNSKGWLRAGISALLIILISISIKLLSDNQIDILYFVKITTYLLTSMVGGIFGVNIFNKKK